jgi:glutamate N-acetyltransferase/amino-acid N-acetyltransferase
VTAFPRYNWTYEFFRHRTDKRRWSGFAAGILAATARAGIKTQGDDLSLNRFANAREIAAAVFTQNQVKPRRLRFRRDTSRTGSIALSSPTRATPTAAPVCRAGRCTTHVRPGGKAGRCSRAEVLRCSTGIIGHALPMNNIEATLPKMETSTREALNEAAARAVMTTDTVPKFCAARTTINGTVIAVGVRLKVSA